MPVETKVTDTRTIQVSVPAEQHETVALGDFVANAAREGYSLSKADTIEGGSQRDPYTIGVQLTLTREGPNDDR